MELRGLKYFYYVARDGGFTQAAKTLKVAQPAISKMVKQLEEELGLVLFEKSGRGVRLTQEGNELYRRSELIFDHFEDIQKMRKADKGELSGTLFFGAAEPVASHILPKILPKFLEKHPQVKPFCTAGTASELQNLLCEKKMEFALTFHAGDLRAELEIAKRYPVPFRLVVAKDKKSSKEVCSNFIGSREVDNTANKIYPTLSLLRKSYPAAQIGISCNSLSAHLEFVRSGLGVSVLPEYLVKDDIKKGRLVDVLPKADFPFDMKLICLRGTKLSPLAKAFLEDSIFPGKL